MDSVFAVCGKDFAVVAGDATAMYSIIRLQDTMDKIIEVDKNKLIGMAGDDAAASHFGNYVQKNLHLIRLRNQGKPSSPKTAANFCRTELAHALRQGPFQVDCLVTGIDPVTNEAELYWVDWLGSIAKVKTGAVGYGSHFVMGLMDKVYHTNITREEATELIKQCIHAIQTRYAISQRSFVVKTVTSDGLERTEIHS